ncbi:MAG: exodeoxyribonuclease V subunit gamma [Planctomycetaceae bacterium]|nr:exodeoxyribonuclease V subunit gamma [Planctomycetaceae bacterium]
MASVELRRGLDPAGLMQSVLREYVAHRQQESAANRVSTGLWLTPTKRSRRDVIQRILGLARTTHFAPQVMTFEDFAESLVKAADQPATRISPTIRRLLLRRITRDFEQSGMFRHFRGVAATAGFLDVVAGFISELKRDEIWPEDFLQVTTQRGRTADRDRELGLVYQRYQDVLQERNWYDNEGRTWLARTMLLEGKCRALPPWSLIAVVGFSDFTRPQFEILEALGQRTDRLVMTLADEPTDGRDELFAKCRGTRARLRSSFPQRVETLVEPTVAAAPAYVAPIRNRLFGNPRDDQPAPSAAGLTIVAATGPDSEWRAIALRIKSLIASGVRPGEIAVGVRSLTEEGERWGRALQSAGIPTWTEAGSPLRLEGIVKFLIAALQTEAEDWAYPRLMSVLGSTYFNPPALRNTVEADVRAASTVLRQLRIPQDRMAILDIVRRVATVETNASRRDEDALEDTQDDLQAHAIAATRVLMWYQNVTAPLRRDHTLGDWIDALAEFVSAVGFGLDPQLVNERPGWDQVQRVIRDAAVAETEWTDTPAMLTLSEFLLEFRDLLASEERDPPPEHTGSVRVLSMDQLRHVDTPHLFLVGLTEESFPRRRGDDCLFTDAERERLVAQGLPLRHAALHQQEEAYFFWSLLMRGTQSLTLSYAAVNVRGQPAFASPYVMALRRLFTPAALPVRHEGQLDPIPPVEESLTLTDQRLMAMESARTGRAGWLRSLGENTATRPMVNNVIAALDMAMARFETKGFTSYEGRLEQTTNQRRLQERFGPKRQFSATEFEAYANCPFRFWLSTVLGIEPLASMEEGTDHLRRGVVVHDVLADLRSEMAGIAREELAERFSRLVSDRLQRTVTETELQRALTRLEERLLTDWASAYSQQFDNYRQLVQQRWEEGWNINRAEVPFGDVPRRPSEKNLEIAPPLAFSDGTEMVFVRGRIDRVDVAMIQGRTVYNVIDYKTGRPPRISVEDVRSGRAVQLVLYAFAVKQLGLVAEDALPFQLGYWAVRETGFKAGLSQRGPKGFTRLDAAVWESLEKLLTTILPRLAAGIRSGEFVVDNPDPDCTGRCPYRTVCRVNQIRPVVETLHKNRSPLIQPDPEEILTNEDTA